MVKKKSSRTLFTTAALLGVIAGAVVGSRYYGLGVSTLKEGEASMTRNIGGQKFLRWKSPRELPMLSFEDEAGKMLTLADFRGRTVLLNIWATWCPPCREEMPSLDRLNAKRGGSAFEVLALSIDGDPAAVRPFYRETGIKTLQEYFDPKGRSLAVLGAFAVPVTLLIDKNGLEIGRAIGPAEWDSQTVESLIDEVQVSGEK